MDKIFLVFCVALVVGTAMGASTTDGSTATGSTAAATSPVSDSSSTDASTSMSSTTVAVPSTTSGVGHVTGSFAVVGVACIIRALW